MYELNLNLRLGGQPAAIVDDALQPLADPPTLLRDVPTRLNLRLFQPDGTPWPAETLQERNWELVLADDWNTATPPQLRASRITAAADRLLIELTEMNSRELAAVIAAKPGIFLGAELAGFSAGESEPDRIIQFDLYVRNRRALDGNAEPVPLPKPYYTASQVDSLLRGCDARAAGALAVHDGAPDAHLGQLATLAAALDPFEPPYVYGILYNPNDPSPDCQRILLINNQIVNVDSFDQTPAHGFRRCVIDDLAGRHINYYLDPDDSTRKADGSDAVLTGADGDVMVEVPVTYWRCKTLADGKVAYLVSDRPFPLAEPHPYFYVSPGGNRLRAQYVGAFSGVLCDADGRPKALANAYRGNLHMPELSGQTVGSTDWTATFRQAELAADGNFFWLDPITNLRGTVLSSNADGVTLQLIDSTKTVGLTLTQPDNAASRTIVLNKTGSLYTLTVNGRSVSGSTPANFSPQLGTAGYYLDSSVGIAEFSFAGPTSVHFGPELLYPAEGTSPAYADGDRLRSIAGGKQASRLTITQFRTAAAAGGAYLQNSLALQFFYLMAVIDAGSFAVQRKINSGFVGLRTNSAAPFRPTGLTASCGNATGEILHDPNAHPDLRPADWDASTPKHVIAFSFHGIENLWGESWKYEDGLLKLRNGYYHTADCSLYTDEVPPPGWQWQDHPWPPRGYATGWAPETFLPLSVGGSSTTYSCSYFYNNENDQAYFLYRGGGVGNGSGNTGPGSASPLVLIPNYTTKISGCRIAV